MGNSIQKKQTLRAAKFGFGQVSKGWVYQSFFSQNTELDAG